jgi:hypothetical protein
MEAYVDCRDSVRAFSLGVNEARPLYSVKYNELKKRLLLYFRENMEKNPTALRQKRLLLSFRSAGVLR